MTAKSNYSIAIIIASRLVIGLNISWACFSLNKKQNQNQVHLVHACALSNISYR